MRAREATFAIAVAAALSCGRAETLPGEGQFVVRVDTDAPLPSVDPTREPPLFDRMRIELFPPGAKQPCAGCTREFAADRETFEDGRASFGFVPSAPGPGHRVRVRLFRAVWLVDGEPPAATTIETVAALPDAPAEGIVRATVTLRMDDLARPRGTIDAPVPADPADSPKLALWDGAKRTPCAGAPRDEEACAPGGAYWMGDPAIRTLDPHLYDGALPRVVSLSPFFVDRHETTVRDWRAAYGDPPLRGNDPGVSEGVNLLCTLTRTKGANEDKPLNCITIETARAHCVRQGKDLLTEARFEYLASGLTGQPYVWGNDPPTCADAVYARDPSGTARQKACMKPGVVAGPADVGSGARDRLALEGGEIVDLAGNLSELVLDDYRREDDPACWGTGVFRDPACRVTSRSQSLRGGSWTLIDLTLRPQLRGNEAKPIPQLTSVGFRCAR